MVYRKSELICNYSLSTDFNKPYMYIVSFSIDYMRSQFN